MDLKARFDVNCEWTDGRTDGRKIGRLFRILLKQVRQKKTAPKRANSFYKELIPDPILKSETEIKEFASESVPFN